MILEIRKLFYIKKEKYRTLHNVEVSNVYYEKTKPQKYSKLKAYSWCHGYLPRVLNVQCFDGILFHAGNSAKDTRGCLLTGRNTQVGKVLESMATLKKLYARLKEAKGFIWLEIK